MHMGENTQSTQKKIRRVLDKDRDTVKYRKLEIPIFSGDGPIGWLFQVMVFPYQRYGKRWKIGNTLGS